MDAWIRPMGWVFPSSGIMTIVLEVIVANENSKDILEQFLYIQVLVYPSCNKPQSKVSSYPAPGILPSAVLSSVLISYETIQIK